MKPAKARLWHEHSGHRSTFRVSIKHAVQFDEHVLVEKWIEGEEYTVALLDNSALPVIRLETPHEFYDFEAKYQANDTLYHCPSGLNEQDETYLKTLAEEAFKAIDAKGWGRIDVMRAKEGNWYLLEANTVPGMTEKACAYGSKSIGY